jgi:FixJ family two-component response regulator
VANILIVDDDLDIAEAFSDLLQSVGHHVRIASTGEEGLRLLQEPPLPAVIVLDVEMPVLGGPGMAHQMLLHNAGEEKIPIVLVSGNIDLPEIAARMGTPYFLLKPPDIYVFLDLVDRALRERAAPVAA